MIHALQRFSIPNDFLHIVDAIYSSRVFFIHNINIDSATKSQRAGISKRCSLSQVLFVIVMSKLIADARQDFIDEVCDDAKFVSEIICAYDTLNVDDRGDLVSIYMKCILEQDEHYSLTFNWDKLAMIYIN